MKQQKKDTGKKPTPERQPKNNTQVQPIPATPQTPPQEKKKNTETAWKDKYIRLYAELENTKKRQHRDRLAWQHIVNKKYILSLLPTLDDLERAIDNLQQNNPHIQDTKQGLTLILNNLKKYLATQGLEPMAIDIGQEPNPQEHQVLTKAPTTTEELKGKIKQIVTKGYLLNQQVIRHAQVIIGA